MKPTPPNMGSRGAPINDNTGLDRQAAMMGAQAASGLCKLQGLAPTAAATRPVTDLKDLFGRPSKAVPIDAMNKAIAVRGASAR